MNCHNTSPTQIHHKHANHSYTRAHASGGHGMGHGSASEYLRRFWIVTILLIPLALVHPKLSAFLGIPSFGLSTLVQFGLATIIFGFALVFFKHAWHEIKARAYGMMTLVSIAVVSGYLFSVASTFIPALDAEFYLEIATLVWVLLFGHYLEAKSGSAAGDALSEVAKLLPRTAHKVEDGKEVDTDISELKKGDYVVVRPGEKIPADGEVLRGSANVDESLVSGESVPVEKKEGMQVVAGAICVDGTLTIRLTRVGERSTVGQIQKLVEQAGRTKPRSQKIADKASAILTFVAGITALATLLVWVFVIGESFAFAITLAITVLVIACPHALGLAIPTVTTITTTLAVKNGFFIKNLSKIETIRKTDYVVFDKTGTLTEGHFGVTDVVSTSDTDTKTIAEIAASLDQYSSHVIGQSVVAYAREHALQIRDAKNFEYIAGHGSRGEISGTKYVVGNERLIKRMGLQCEIPKVVGTVIFVADEKCVLGYIALSDKVKESSKRAVERLHGIGVKVVMLTGDNEQVARSVSDAVGVDAYFANVLPADKYTHIKKLQDSGATVLMVGDGVNDAPALTQADAGIAIGAGTDVAVESGDVVLTNSNPEDIPRLILLSKKVYAKMIQNLVWALGYNIVAIPAAAGAFAAWGFFLRPEIGALVMSLSTVIVVANALTLKRVAL